MAVKAILQYIDASDCNMEEGSLRMDANISVRPMGEKSLRNKIEIKNMNSFSNMEQALESEIKRQIREYTSNPSKPPGEVIRQATYRWDPEKNETVLMRSKETADDYRYFPEPDLVPIILTEAYIEEIRAALPELPLQRERRYVSELGLSPDSAFIMVSDKGLADYFEEGLKICSNGRSLCNWIIVEFAGRYKDSGTSLLSSGITPDNVATLVNMIDKGTITGKIAKSVADDMVANPQKSCEEIVAGNPDYQPVHDQKEIEILIDKVIVENSQSVADYKAGRDKAFAYLVGQVMKLSRGKASPQVVNEILKKKMQS
jgi:aspartyl-tRNA(Asn)/glutamyl-tRNA(Gln) amidotransferase subunit B